MFLLNPAALGFAVLVPLIVALYLLKLRRQPAQVSTLMFWQRVTADTRRRALFQRLRQVFSLLLQLLIFALLLFALARPEWRTFHGEDVDSAIILVLDARARMQTTLAAGGTRFDAARAVAESYLRRASARQPMALLVADGTTRVAVGLTGDEKTLLDGLANVQPSDAGGSLEDALRLAGELHTGRIGGKIVVISDRTPTLPPAVSAVSVDLRLVAVGESPRENVGLTRFSARALPNSPDTGEVFVEFENFGLQRRTGNIELSYEGRLVDVRPYDLAPGERRAEVYPALSTRSGVLNARGWLTARLAPTDNLPDALTLDDDACAVLPPPRSLRVLLVTHGDFFLENLLRADSGVAFEQLTPDTFRPAQAAGFDVTIFDDALPPDFSDTPDALPPGNVLFIHQAPLPLAGNSELTHPPITNLDATNPLLRLTNLRDADILRAQAWTLPEAKNTGGWRLDAPVRSLEHPLVVTGERGAAGVGKQRFVALAFGTADSDLPLRVAFPLFIRNTLDWLASRNASSVGNSALRAGEVVPLAEGQTVWKHVQRAYQPINAVPPEQTVSGPSVFRPLRNGFYLWRGPGTEESWLAVNTADRETSAVNTPESVIGRGPMSDFAAPWSGVTVWPPWVTLACLALTLCALEWWGFHRRRTE